MDSTKAVQQIQALTASVDELTQQNSELRNIVEDQSDQRNEERHKNNNGNHRRTRALEENSSRMESKLMRREMGELRNAMKNHELSMQIYMSNPMFKFNHIKLFTSNY